MPDKPPPTFTAEESLKGLWASLKRGGEHWSEEVVLTPTAKGHTAIFYLTDDLPKGAVKYVSSYAKTFLKSLGWRSKVQVLHRYVRIELSID